MKYRVTVPIGGHARLVVEAASEEEAIAKAMEQVYEEHIAEWDVIETVNEGYICHFPPPWTTEVECLNSEE